MYQCLPLGPFHYLNYITIPPRLISQSHLYAYVHVCSCICTQGIPLLLMIHMYICVHIMEVYTIGLMRNVGVCGSDL